MPPEPQEGTCSEFISALEVGMNSRKWTGPLKGAGRNFGISLSAIGGVALLLTLTCNTMALAGDAILSWDPNSESDLAGYRVYFGTAPGVYGSPINAGTQTTYTVTGLGLGTFYFAVTAYNTAGAESGLSREVSKTFVGADVTPPAISGISSTGVTSSGVSISWSTNEPSDSQVQYGTTTTYGSSTALNLSLITSHAQSLTGLLPSTTYHYRVISKDAAGNVATSGDNTFVTAAVPDTTPPLISGIVSSNISGTGAVITWSTNEAATSQVEYGASTAYGSTSALNSTFVISHSRSLNGLSPATTYHFRVISRDAAGNIRTSGDNTFITTISPDTTPPVISNIAATQISDRGAVITWRTNEAATSELAYGTAVSYGLTSISMSPLVTDHSLSLTGLNPSTTYHFRITNRDDAGNISSSTDRTFVTLSASDITGPVISGVSASGVTEDTMVITWVTDEASTSEVEYGPTTAYGSVTSLNATLAIEHTEVLSGLVGTSLYHYRVRSADTAGNLSVSEDHAFTTADITAPTDVKEFRAEPHDGTVHLSWVAPSDPDFAGVVVRYRTDGTYPVTEMDGLPVGDFKALPGEKVQTDHIGLRNKVTYYYSAFTYDIHGNYSRTAKISATPEEGERAPLAPVQAGGCGMIIPKGGSSGPGQAADMMALIGVLLIAFIKTRVKASFGKFLPSHHLSSKPEMYFIIDPNFFFNRPRVEVRNQDSIVGRNEKTSSISIIGFAVERLRRKAEAAQGDLFLEEFLIPSRSFIRF